MPLVREMRGRQNIRIVTCVTGQQLLTDPAAYAAMAHASNPYGDGKASVRIADALTRA